MFGSLDVSSSALAAYRVRMNVIANNMANAHTTRDASGTGGPYRRRVALFAPGAPGLQNGEGVRVSEVVTDPAPFRKVKAPDHPDAVKTGPDAGYVYYPNVDPLVEMVDMMAATRAYQANITAFEAAKSIVGSALRLLT
ncbi:MAG: flagellar basal body rod protein FlgC [Planctomycetes bacterium]|nr:flagellar basal body rod protein FlgC [Planctomycetota bacterium]